MRDIESGCSGKYTLQADRALAIALAVAEASAGDCVLIAGKGHEDYQLVDGERLHFSDAAQAHDALARRARVVMRPMSLMELQTPLAAHLHGDDTNIAGVSTDSRILHRGDLFVALRGDHFDGHDYVSQVEQAALQPCWSARQLLARCPNCWWSIHSVRLGLLGAYNRQLYRGPLVAITGSSGKTTVKNMVHAVFSRCGETLATEGNFNNEIGVPLTLLRLRPEIEYRGGGDGRRKSG